jgi:hypothetical protein
MANNPTDSNPFCALGRKKFDLNLRSQRQVRDGKQAHPNIAKIDAESIHLRKVGEHLHSGVQQLALAATPVLSGVTSKNHLGDQSEQGTAVIL